MYVCTYRLKAWRLAMISAKNMQFYYSCVFCFGLLKMCCSYIPYQRASSCSESSCYGDATIHETQETLDETRQQNLSGASESGCNTGISSKIHTYLSYFSLLGTRWWWLKTWLSQSVFMVISEFTHHTEAWAGFGGRGPVNYKLFCFETRIFGGCLEKIPKQRHHFLTALEILAWFKVSFVNVWHDVVNYVT